MAGGRPTDYDPKYCAMLLEHMRGGLSFESFAGEIPVARQTIYNWCDKYPEFLDAKNIGQSLARTFWEKVNRNAVMGQLKDSKGRPVQVNSTLLIFTMKNMVGWKNQIEHSGYIESSEAAAESREQMEARIAELEERRKRKKNAV